MTSPSRRMLVAAAIGLAALFAQAGGLHAQPIDMSHGGPITVTARDGMDWRQNDQEVVARGDAVAIRDNVTVTADVLIAHYRKKAGANPAAGGAGAPSGGAQPVAAKDGGPINSPPASAKPAAPPAAGGGARRAARRAAHRAVTTAAATRSIAWTRSGMCISSPRPIRPGVTRASMTWTRRC